MTRSLCAGALGVALLCAVGPAAGEPAEPIALAWTAPPGCPREREVHAAIERVLGGPPDAASQRYLRAEARVSRAGAGAFHVHLVTDLGGVIGERDLDGPTCGAVANATALIVALTFDPEALARRAEAAASPAPSPAAPPSPAPPAPPSPAPPEPPPEPPPAVAPRPRVPPPPPPEDASPEREPPRPAVADGAPLRRPRFAVGAFGAASAGALPGVAEGVGGRIGVLIGRFRADVSASYWIPKATALPGQSALGGNFSLIAGDASACYAVLRAPVELSPCLGMEVGSMAATGFGVRMVEKGSALWVAPAAEADVALPIGAHFAARLDVGVLLPVELPPFVLLPAGTVYTAGPVVGRATLGLEVRF